MNNPLRILLIDDNPDDRTLIMRELRQEFPDLQAEQVTKAKGFAQALEAGDFNLVITDYQVRWTDGLEVLRRVKARWPDCPVIMFTDTGNEEIAVEAMKAGLDDYMVKSPIRFVRLPAAVRLALERGRQRQAMKEAEIRYRSLFNGMPVGLYRTTPEGQILDANPALVHMLGYPDRETLLAVNAPDLCGNPEEHRRWLALMEREGVVRDFEAQVRRGDGTVIWVRHSARAVPGAEGRALYYEGVVEDITEHKRVEAERARYAAQLKGLAGASLVINSALSLDSVLQIVTEQAREVIGAHQSVTSFTVDENWAQAISAISLSDKYAAWREYDEKPDGSGIYRLVCQMSRPVRMTQAELEAHPAWRGFGKEAGKHPPMRGWLAAPLTGRDGRNIGLIQLSDKYEGEFTEDDEAILVQLAQMASVAVENARLFEQVNAGRERLHVLSRRLVEVQETERREIARELHDEIGQVLTGLKLALETSTPSPTAAVRTSLNEAQALVNELMARVRELSLDLRPAILDDVGLLPALLWHFERYTAQTNVHVTFKHTGLEGGRFPPDIETAVYRIVQEALTNVARHAGVSEVTVRLWVDDGMLSVQIDDQGTGFDSEVVLAAAGTGGLAGMRERAALLYGQLTVDSTPGAGTRLTAELPVKGLVERRKKDQHDDDSAGR